MEKILCSIEKLLAEILAFLRSAPPDRTVGIHRSVSLNATPVQLLPEECSIVGWFLSNSATSAIYFKLYDAVNQPDVATSKPDLTLMLPAGSAANASFDRGIAFHNGIWAIAVAGYADGNTTGAGAGEAIANFMLEAVK